MSDQSGQGQASQGQPDQKPPGPFYGEVPRYGYQHEQGGPSPYPTPQPYQQPYPEQYQPPYQEQYQAPYQQPYQQPYGQPYQQPSVPVYPYAHWIRRVGAYVIDFAPMLVAQIPFFVGYVQWLTAFSSDVSLGRDTVPTTGLVWMGIGTVLMLAAFGWQIYNRWLTAGRTGQSLGKRVLKLHLYAEATGAPIGPLNAFLRDLLHVVDGIAYVGYLWPLWDDKRQTFSDKLMKTVVTDDRERQS